MTKLPRQTGTNLLTRGDKGLSALIFSFDGVGLSITCFKRPEKEKLNK